jgi:anti-anti-sigma regulatory factor
VINSIGISILIEIIEKMQEAHGTLAFCHLTRTIQKTFTIMGLTQYAALFDTEDDAVRGVLAEA